MSAEGPRRAEAMQGCASHTSAALNEAIQELEQLSGCPSLQPVRHLLERSACFAAQATTLATRALVELNFKCQDLRVSDDKKRKVQKVQLMLRDLMLWRFFGLQAGLLDVQKLDDCLLRSVIGDNVLETQLKNSYLRIQLGLLQELICSDILRKLVRHLLHSPDDEGLEHVFGQLQWANHEIESAQRLLDDNAVPPLDSTTVPHRPELAAPDVSRTHAPMEDGMQSFFNMNLQSLFNMHQHQVSEDHTRTSLPFCRAPASQQGNLHSPTALPQQHGNARDVSTITTMLHSVQSFLLELHESGLGDETERDPDSTDR